MSDIFWMGEKGQILEYRTPEELAALQFDAWREPWLRTWAAIGWLGSTDILQQTFQGAMTHTIAALMNFKNAVDALHSRQDNMRVDLARLQQRLK